MLYALIVFVLVIAIPVGFLMSMSVAAAIIGQFLTRNAEIEHADSELLDCNI